MISALAITFTIGGLSSGSTPLLLGAACLVALLVVDLVFLQRGVARRVLRVGPRRCVAGRPFVEAVLVEAPLGAERVFGIEIVEPASRRRDSAATICVHDGGERTLVHLDARFRERGLHEERGFELRCRSPFSCFVAKHSHTLPAALCVEPARLAVDEVLLRSLDAQLEIPARATMTRGDEFWSLRELRHGEDLRGVHALRSMSQGCLLVRETRSVLQTRLEIVLDLRARTDTMTQHSRFELALRFAASLGDRYRDPALRLRATLVGDARGHAVFDLEHELDRHRFLEALAAASPQAVAPLPEETLEHFDRRRADARCILIESGVEDPALLARVGDSVRPLHVRGSVAGARATASPREGAKHEAGDRDE